ncbi:hypothetical protein BGZ61DRAFT_460676 [Ilyonectria robusta]|uniref:uncharacterized protein n=1 Tax=Ilyonectria robusta TaxID=1079257 RepID=UPI001E8CACB9|nr:uncharacterized protein BGZ61DRAFT_460676 [Ilyonectria robusta]KAH8669267.1 hypothetical protein BGZ61DRAFT_460676 [Ilyonectria robusta]
MATAALTNLLDFVPFWIKRVETEIEQHQARLAAVAAADGENLETTLFHHKESAGPLATLVNTPEIVALYDPSDKDQAKLVAIAATDGKKYETASLRKRSTDSLATLVNTPEIVALDDPSDKEEEQNPTFQQCPSAGKQSQGGIEREWQQTKTRQRSPSMIALAEGTPRTYGTGNRTQVYYDSLGQSYFHDIHQFASFIGCLIRKAKTAVITDHFKRLAKMDVSEEGKNGENDLEAFHSQRQMTPWRSRLMELSRQPSFGPGRDNDQLLRVYYGLGDEIDKLGRMCEGGAYRLLRDGECSREITHILNLLVKLLKMTNEEMELVKREEPEFAKEAGELSKVCTSRHILMRGDCDDRDGELSRLEAAESTIDPSATPEVADINEAGEGANVSSKRLKLLYQRTMQNRRPPGL